MNLYVPYSGEPLDLLARTLGAVSGAPVTVVVIDNSHDQRLRDVADLVPILPVAPLTLWQTLWMLVKIEDPFLWTQCDAEVKPGAVTRLLESVHGLDPHKWGVVFTHYDLLSSLNAPELSARNCLPDLNLPHYHGDPDWYRRMRLSGLETVEIGGNDVTHAPGGGGHWRNTPDRDVARQCMDSGRYYREKWGGDIGHETYRTPWNR